MKKGFIIGFFLILFCLTFISAVPPVTQIQQLTEGYQIQIPQDNILKVNEAHTFQFHVYNISNGMELREGVSCSLHLYNKTGDHLYNETTSISSDGDYIFYLSSGNFSYTQTDYYRVSCNSSALGGYGESILYVTNTGNEPSSAESMLYLISLIGILIIFGICIYFAIILPFGNNRGEDFKIISVNKLKYIKLILILLSYALFSWILNLLIGLSLFLSLSMYYGFFKMLFEIIIGSLTIFFIIWGIFFILTLVKDLKINKMLKKGFKPD